MIFIHFISYSYSSRVMASLANASSWGVDANGNKKDLTRLVFDKYDIDGNGSISKEEFVQLIYSLGRHMDEMEQEAAFSFIELNGDSKIAYGEFKRFWLAEDRWGLLKLDEDQLAALWQVADYFKYYDEDNSGVLSYEQFTNVYDYMKSSGYALHGRTVDQVFSDIDTTQDSNINYNEFIRWMVELGVLLPDGILRTDLTAEEVAEAAKLDDEEVDEVDEAQEVSS